MNKIKYTEPKLEIVMFDSEDMIVASIITPEDVFDSESTALFGNEFQD